MHQATSRSGEVGDVGAGKFSIELAGPFRIRAPGGEDLTPLGRKARGLLAYLVFKAGDVVPRERLMALLWSERGEDQARASLRQCLHELRRLNAEAAGPLGIDRHHVAIAPALIATDLARFDTLVADNDAPGLTATLDGMTRPLLEDLNDLDPAFDEWLAIERTRYEDRQGAQIVGVIQHALARNDTVAARDLAIALVARHPTNEEAARLAMTASHGCGQRDAVRRIEQRLEAALQRDLGAVPSPETLRHFERLMKAPTAVETPRAPEQMIGETADVRPARAPMGRRTVALAALVTGVLLTCGIAFLARTPTQAAGETILVRPLRVAPEDNAAQSLRQGLAADLARAVIDKDAVLRIVENGGTDTVDGTRFILDGEARTGNGELQATISLRSNQSGEILWSRNFSEAAADGDGLRQQATAGIAAVLTCALGAKNRGGTSLTDGTIRLYLTGCDKMTTDADPEAARKIFKQVIVAAPDFSRAWSDLAVSSSWAAEDLEGADAEAMRVEARAEAARALDLDPHNGKAYYARALTLPDLALWSERTELLTAGLAVEPDNAELNDAMAKNLGLIGRRHEALVFGRRSVASDPLSPSRTANLIQSLAYDGRLAEAEKILASAERLWPSDSLVWGARLSLAARYGDPAGALRVLHDPRQASTFSPQHFAMWDRVLQALETPTPENIDIAVAAILANEKSVQGSNPTQMVQQLIVIGRVDDAFALIGRNGGAVATGGDIWSRNYMAAFRADPRFMPMAYREGLVQVWVKTGKWPDFCVEKTVPYDCEAEAHRLMAAAHAP